VTPDSKTSELQSRGRLSYAASLRKRIVADSKMVTRRRFGEEMRAAKEQRARDMRMADVH
jgi:hypothetical protein